MDMNNSSGVSPEFLMLLKGLHAQIEDLQKQLNNTTAVKDAEIAHLKEVIETYQRMIFGSKSEKTVYMNDLAQLSLFDKDAEPDAATDDSTETIHVDGYDRKPKGKKRNADYIEAMVKSGKFKIESETIDLPEEDRFDADGNPLEFMGYAHVRYELCMTPPEYFIKDIQRASYGSARNRDEDGNYRRDVVKEAIVPPAVIPHSPVGESVLADLILNKCDYGLPAYRQARMMRDRGIPINRNVLSAWFISASRLLEAVWTGMKRKAKQQKTIHADETFCQVLHNATGNPRAQLDFWAYCTGQWEPIQVACFEYCPSREGKNAKRFLDGYTGKIITDGCSSYKAVAQLERGGCWAHTRRYWYMALPVELRSKQTKADKLDDKAIQTVDPEKCIQLKCFLLINELFRYERQYDKKNLTGTQRLEQRKKDCTPILDQYWETVEALARENTTGNLHKAVTYSMNQREHLMKFMEHGDMPISNNAVERQIRNLVIGRKNWLFCDTEAGAQAVAILYSIVVTAHANGLDVRAYLEYLIRAMTNKVNGVQQPSEQELEAYVDGLLPWADEIQAQFLAYDPFDSSQA